MKITSGTVRQPKICLKEHARIVGVAENSSENGVNFLLPFTNPPSTLQLYSCKWTGLQGLMHIPGIRFPGRFCNKKRLPGNSVPGQSPLLIR